MITREPKNILIADDSMFFRIKLKDILAESGHIVRFVKDGKDAIAEIERNPAGVDLMTLDLDMAEVNGFGVLEWLKKNGLSGRFPVIVITSKLKDKDLLGQLKTLGVAGFLPKSFSPQHLVLKVNSLLFREKARRGVPRERTPVSFPVDFTTQSGAMNSGFILNISDHGLYVNSKHKLTKGETLRLRFRLPETSKEMDLTGVVKWVVDDTVNKSTFCGGGIALTSITLEDVNAIKEYIKKNPIGGEV